MLIFDGQAALIAHLNRIKTADFTIGFVPTMGALHQGHLSLMKQSLSENQITVVSIFVNPTQFNNPEDLLKYPRNLDQDIQKIGALSADIIIYAPPVADVYSGDVVSDSFNFDGLEHQMEGKFRPGHFNGVGTIVKRLFEIVAPTKAYFGEKDFQQLQIVRKMVEKNQLDVEIVGCEIYREKNGLAMSSRNERLTDEQKKEAGLIYKTLIEAKEKFQKNSSKAVSEWVKKQFEKSTLFQLEYFQIADETSLTPATRKNADKKYRAFIAVLVNNVRLIDTISLN